MDLCLFPLADLVLAKVEDARFIFEARTVQRMELLVLSTLGWRLGSPTPLSFIDHFLRRLAAGDKAPPPSSWKRRYAHLHWKFQASCHSILLNVAAGEFSFLLSPPFPLLSLFFTGSSSLHFHPLRRRRSQMGPVPPVGGGGGDDGPCPRPAP